ncbi:hypothetical protein CAPTEDRAFT_187033 [Capitella teleta]|uniref:non-specific serine/threonine protein kinase n=1 Tax=Capitella teleta TaxID=283909 RepID=R7TDS1_CAPTE|nr:hypothetical protein CAPTEDRAFT_187033 [Capitella teleta]|eukprot:ELT89642.1 hypothetical protein CAPTEDRAFT_187033 [Capitella teleta]
MASNKQSAIDYDFMKNVVQVTDVVPSQPFLDAVADLLNKGSLSHINFSGIDQLTDEVFILLRDAFKEKPDAAKGIVKLSCVGCSFITDEGILEAVQTFPNLEEVVLDGCKMLTEFSARHVLAHCDAISHLSMRGVDVLCTRPNITDDDRVINLDFRTIPQAASGPTYHPPIKLVITRGPECQFSLLEFLKSKISTKQQVELSSVPYASQSVTIENVSSPIMIHELGSELLSWPLLSKSAMYFIVLRLEAEEDFVQETFSKIFDIQGSVSSPSLIVIILHDDADAAKKRSQIFKLQKELKNYTELQQKNILSSIEEEHYKRTEPFCDRDFQAQQRFARATFYARRKTDYSLFALNVETCEVTAFNNADDAIEMKEDDDGSDMLEAATKLQSLNKADITEMKSFENPRELVKLVMNSFCVLFDRPQSWQDAKKMLGNPTAFIESLRNYKAKSITTTMWKKLEKIINVEDMTVENGPASIQRALQNSFQNQQKALYLNDLHLRDFSFMFDLRELLQNFTTDRIFSAAVLIEALQSKHPDQRLNCRLILRMIGLLEDWGCIILVPDDVNPNCSIVVADIDWFMTLLHSFQSNSKPCNVEFKALSKHVPIHSHESIQSLLKSKGNASQIDMFIKVLRHYSLLINVPARCTREMNYGRLLLFSQLPEKILLEDQRELKDLWPDTPLPTDYSIMVSYHFIYGPPPSLWPLIVSESSLIGSILVAAKFEFIVTLGAVEILVQLRKSEDGVVISIEGRLTNWSAQSNQTVFEEYLWAAINRYLLLVECFIHRCPALYAAVRLHCPKCTDTKHNSSSIPRHINARLNCCDEMTKELNPLINGRLSIVPFHNYVEGISTNTLAPYAHHIHQLNASKEINPLWHCLSCGSTHLASHKSWDMESCLYPCFTENCINWNSSSFKGFSVRGPLIGVEMSQDTETSNPKNALLATRVRTLRSGPCTLSFTVLSLNKIEIFVADQQTLNKISEEINSAMDPSDTSFYYNLIEGEIQTIDFARSSEKTYERQTHIEENLKCEPGDVVEITVHGEKYQALSDESSVMTIGISVFKNGSFILKTAVLRFRSILVMKLQSVLEAYSGPLLLYHHPKFPLVRAAHFTLGSSLLQKTEIDLQWNIVKVLARKNGFLYIGNSASDLDENLATRVLPSSENIRPLGKYNDAVTMFKDGSTVRKFTDQLQGQCMAHFCLFRPMADVTFRPLIIKSKPFSKFCIESSNSPNVLEQIFLQSMKSPGKTRSSLKFAYAVLPSNLILQDFETAPRHRLQNWLHQEAHFLCKGNQWNTNKLGDSHFMPLKPYQLSSEDLPNVDYHSEMLITTYFALDNQTCILPSPSPCVTFPKLAESVKEDEILEGLWRMMHVLRCTFVLVQKASSADQKRLKKKDRDALVPFLAELTTSAEESGHYKEIAKNCVKAKKLVNLQRCVLHTNIAKPGPFKDMLRKQLQGDETFTKNVKHVEIAHTLTDNLEIILRKFPSLKSLSLTHCSIKSLCPIKLSVQISQLNLSNNLLSEIPSELFVLKDSLENMDLSGSPIRLIPEFLMKFPRLTRLDLSRSLISELPENFGDLSNLEVLIMAACPLTALPDSFCKLKNLRILALDGVPWCTTKTLKDDETLSKENCKFFQEYPVYQRMGIKALDALFDKADVLRDGILQKEELIAFRKMLFEKIPRFQATSENDPNGGIPAPIFRLKKLKSLSLNFQGIRCIPHQIEKLTDLTMLSVRHCPNLLTLGNGLGKCPLNVLDIDACDALHTPPKEIREQGNRIILSYIKRLSLGSSACYRTKLMYVGLGGAGKTSLMRALMSADYKAPQVQGEGITDGIDITNWSVKKEDVSLVFSVWDFAGQTIYYNTHQFFLSSRAVYMLVWNTRLGFEHSGLDFWLSSISCHCPKAPVFIIGTHADQITNADLPEAALRKRYPNIKGFYSTSAVTGKGINDVFDHLLLVTLEQPYIGEMVPEAWLNLEKTILSERGNRKSLIKWSDIESMAQTNSILGSEIIQAVNFLHELGTLQHFNNDLLRDRVVINPQWIVDVMACIVSVHNTLIKDGRLKHEDVGTIWKDYSQELHNWLLRLTEIFDLTFPLSDKAENIVPCLLPDTEPEYPWPNAQEGCSESKIVYHFDYLPAGLFNRAQVRLYQFSDSSAIWKSGSILMKNGHHALVKQLNATDVLVKANGPWPENILLLVHEVFESLISESFSGVKYEFMMPCMSCMKSTSRDPAMFSSKILRRALEMKALFLQCHAFFHVLSISDVQNTMPPQSSADYNLQLENAMRDLDSLQEDIMYDCSIIYCMKDALDDPERIHPKRIVDDLQTEGIRCWYAENLHEMNIQEVSASLADSKIVLVCISDDFVLDGHCQRMFQFVNSGLKKEFLLLMVGHGKEWAQSDIGMQLVYKVYVNFQRQNLYQEKLTELQGQIQGKLKRSKGGQQGQWDVFISYCWTNSAEAVAAGTKAKESALGHGDPRKLAKALADHGLSYWLDIECAGKLGLFEDIAEGMKRSKVIIACVSDEVSIAFNYATSPNCQMEFRFAHVALRKPIILAIVGTGFKWQSTEVGMLSLAYPKINFQMANQYAHQDLLQNIKEKLDQDVDKSTSVHLGDTEQKSAYEELYELAQRKFLRQLVSYVEDLDPYPHLIVADLNYDPNQALSNESNDPDEMDEESEEILEEGSKLTFVTDDLKPGQFCLKVLCEHEGGWHSVDDGIPVSLGGQDLVRLWEASSPYMLRMLSILKHSSADLVVTRTEAGEKLIKLLQQRNSWSSHKKMKDVYMMLRMYLLQKDAKMICGNLKKCYLPSGKHLWLCEEHQKLPRITVLEHSSQVDEQEDVTDEVSPEDDQLERVLLKAILGLTQEDEDFEKENEESEEELQVEPSSPAFESPQTPLSSKSAEAKPTTAVLANEKNEEKLMQREEFKISTEVMKKKLQQRLSVQALMTSQSSSVETSRACVIL